MEKEQVCVFCGQKPGAFRSTTVQCGNTFQFACKSCEKELKDLDEVEICHRALRYGRAENPQKLQDRIALITEAEEHRPVCLRCGTKLYFGKVQTLDNSPLRDHLLSDTFDILPAYCENCGKMEIYDPGYIRRNKYLRYLSWKDTEG